MILRIAGILVLLAALALNGANAASAAPSNGKYEVQDSGEDDYDFSFEVNRLKHHDIDDDDDDDEDEEEYEYEEYDYYLDQLSPLEREAVEREPFIRLPRWKQGWRRHPLFVIILGGFRWDLLKSHEKNLTSFAYLRKHGVSIPFVSPVFPTEDYPVWTSIATGRYAEEHGIVGDFMYDLENKRVFNASDLQSTRHAEWWKDASPFWSTAAKHGKKLAFYNWHDCQLPGATLENIADCRPYTPTPKRAAPSKSKIGREFDEAFTKLYKNKYDLSVVYTDLIRRVAEAHGPDSPALVRALRDIDDILQAKLIDVRSKRERAGIKMNVLVLSDYGMTDTSTTQEVVLDDFIDLDDVQYIIYAAGYASIIPYAIHHEDILHDIRDMPGVDVYLAKQVQDPPIFGAEFIPDKFRYGQGANTQDILIVAKPSFQLVSHVADESPKVIRVHDMEDEDLKAGAGYNPFPEEIKYPYIDKRTIITQKIKDTIRDYKLYHQYKWDMMTQAFAVGPDFKENYVLKNQLRSVDFYQLLCFLLQIPPEFHEGDWDMIEPMLTVSSSTRPAMVLWSLALPLIALFAIAH